MESEFLDEDQIIKDLIKKINEEEDVKERWLGLNKSQLIRLHPTTGQKIRNQYRLWDKENPYTQSDTKHKNFPDAMSQRIIEKVWRQLQDDIR